MVGGREGRPSGYILPGVDQFEFIGPVQDDGPLRLTVFLGADGDPVDAGRQGTGPVGFDMDAETGLVERSDKGIIHLQGRLSAGHDDAAAVSGQRADVRQDFVQGHGLRR